jgi:hypothetical protein
MYSFNIIVNKTTALPVSLLYACIAKANLNYELTEAIRLGTITDIAFNKIVPTDTGFTGNLPILNGSIDFIACKTEPTAGGVLLISILLKGRTLWEPFAYLNVSTTQLSFIGANKNYTLDLTVTVKTYLK